MKLFEKPVLFLTATISPHGMINTAIQDWKERQRQYINAIGYYINRYPYNIVIVENSGKDLSPYFLDAINMGRIEFLTFNMNSINRELGKGYGEARIIEYGFQHSALLQKSDCIIKISGRHKVQNLSQIMKISSFLMPPTTVDFIICDVNRHTQGAFSDCFIASSSFYEKYLIVEALQTDESRGYWFEHALYRSIYRAYKDGMKFISMPFPPKQNGISGSMGTKLHKAGIGKRLLNFAKMISFQIGLIKLDK